MNNVVVTITGPTCSGKTTLLEMLREKFPGKYSEIISTTTRPPRAGEVNGQHYHFVSEKDFLDMMAHDDNIHHLMGGDGSHMKKLVERVKFGDNYYGGTTESFKTAMEQGIPLIVVEPNGVRQIAEASRERDWNHINILINNPIPVIMSRFLNRFQNDSKATADNYAKRLVMLMDEIKYFSEGEGVVNGKQIYVDGFDEGNTEKVLNAVDAAITALMQFDNRSTTSLRIS